VILLAPAGFLLLGAPSASAQVADAQGLGGGTTVMQSNSCFLCFAASGPAISTNVAATNAGPTAGSILGTAQAQQLGSNNVLLNQNSNAKSGDALAGSQVTGVVGGGPSTVMNSNNAIGAVSLSGPAISTNVGLANAGPSAGALLGAANVSQAGNNNVVVNQGSHAVSGDALAGSQVSGVVGGVDPIVMNQNSSIGTLALSGPAISTNVGVPVAGPAALGVLGFSGASQLGDNDAILTQSSGAHSGDALAGSQSTGIVAGGGLGRNFVGGSNFALLPFGFSGPALANNLAFGGPGPRSGPGILGASSASQAGSNTAALDQSIDATSGDGLSGSQVSGVVAQQRGALDIQRERAPDLPAIRE
jgi:hypothetical protein